MKISIITGPWLPVPPLQGGSTNRFWQGLAEKFAAKGHETTIVCRSYKGQPKNEFINGVRYIRYGGFLQTQVIAIDLLKDLIYALSVIGKLPGSDIAVINDFWLPFFIAKLRPDAGKIIVHVGRFPKKQHQFYYGISRFVAISNAISAALSDQCPRCIPYIKVIPNPVDAACFSPSPVSSFAKENKIILYVGRIHPEKGLNVLIDAFSAISKKFPKVTLRIIGPYKKGQGGGGADYLKYLKDKAQGLPIEFLEPVFDLAKLADSYREADIFCYPSLAEKGEALPVAPLEAMAAGLVPVVSDLDCFKDYVDEDKTGCFFDHRAKDAAKNLAITFSSLLTDTEKMRRIGSNAIKKASEYNYDRIADLYLADFEELIKESGKR